MMKIKASPFGGGYKLIVIITKATDNDNGM